MVTGRYSDIISVSETCFIETVLPVLSIIIFLLSANTDHEILSNKAVVLTDYTGKAISSKS